MSVALLDSGRLTACGVDLVSGMLADEAVGEEVTTPEQRAAGREAADDHHVRWLLNNVHPEPDIVDDLAMAWIAGDREPARRYSPPAPRPCPQDVRVNPRLQLRQIRDTEPKRFAAMCADPHAHPEAAKASAGDLAYLRGEYAEAVDLYRQHLADEPENIEHWAGFLLARRQEHDDAASLALRHRPELVRAVHLAVVRLAGTAPDPVALAGWLADVSAWTEPARG